MLKYVIGTPSAMCARIITPDGDGLGLYPGITTGKVEDWKAQ